MDLQIALILRVRCFPGFFRQSQLRYLVKFPLKCPLDSLRFRHIKLRGRRGHFFNPTQVSNRLYVCTTTIFEVACPLRTISHITLNGQNLFISSEVNFIPYNQQLASPQN